MVLTATSEDERDLLAQVVLVSADAIVTEDLDGRITSWNAAAERLYGCSAVESVGRSASDVLTPETAADLRAPHLLARAGERVERYDTWHRRGDGGHVPVSVTVSPLADRRGQGHGGRDQRRGHQRARPPRRRPRGRAPDAGEQHDALRRSNRDLEQFAYVASHDLSEPLRVITGYIQLVDKRYGEHLDERGHRYLEHIVDGASRMRTLIDDLLEYSRFLRAAATPGRVDLTRLARGGRRRARPAGRRGATAARRVGRHGVRDGGAHEPRSATASSSPRRGSRHGSS
jgi:PAS domain S-box-containing protein